MAGLLPERRALSGWSASRRYAFSRARARNPRRCTRGGPIVPTICPPASRSGKARNANPLPAVRRGARARVRTSRSAPPTSPEAAPPFAASSPPGTKQLHTTPSQHSGPGQLPDLLHLGICVEDPVLRISDQHGLHQKLSRMAGRNSSRSATRRVSEAGSRPDGFAGACGGGAENGWRFSAWQEESYQVRVPRTTTCRCSATATRWRHDHRWRTGRITTRKLPKLFEITDHDATFGNLGILLATFPGRHRTKDIGGTEVINDSEIRRSRPGRARMAR